MRIAICAVGSRGDVQPALGLAVALAAGGHDVKLATHTTFETTVTERGIGFAPLTGNPEEMMGTAEVQRLLASGRNPVSMIERFAALLAPRWADYVGSTGEAVAGVDVVLYSPLAFAAFHLAEAHDIPSGLLALQPFGTTGLRAPVTSPVDSLGRVGNRTAHALQQWLAWSVVRRMVDPWRVDMGLTPLGRRGPAPALRRRREPIMHGFSPSLVPPPADWPPWYTTTGYWFLPEPIGWHPPAGLAEFLAAGPPPVYAGFGSMADDRNQDLTGSLVSACRAQGLRLLVSAGWGGLEKVQARDVFGVDDVPHSWLFPHVTAVVHHGGAGTTGTAAAAGVPQLIIPFFADQPFWARRIETLGLGRRIGKRRATPMHITEALRTVTGDGPREQAKVMARRLEDEDGVGNAVRAIERWVLSRA